MFAQPQQQMTPDDLVRQFLLAKRQRLRGQPYQHPALGGGVGGEFRTNVLGSAGVQSGGSPVAGGFSAYLPLMVGQNNA